ncbi:MAG: hypothetical protein OXC01_14050 [Immundisolibacterales bacterium]|nr:hypothetical protein [Immundisolibacterales bacterium]
MNEKFGVYLDQARAFLADRERRRRARIDDDGSHGRFTGLFDAMTPVTITPPER